MVTPHTRTLVGMVIAAYENEPYVHIMTREKLVKDIKAALPNGFEVKLDAGDSTDI